MANNQGGILFVNCIGSDINVMKKEPTDTTFEFETCLLFDEPEYLVEEYSDNTIWKFYCDNTKRYLLANGERTFQVQKYECPKKRVEITLPLYTLKELCLYTTVTRLLVNNTLNAIDDLNIPKTLKTDLKQTANDLTEILESVNGELLDYTCEDL